MRGHERSARRARGDAVAIATGQSGGGMAFCGAPRIMCSARSPCGAAGVATCESRPAILAAVAERAALRARHIAEDAARKRAAWDAELAALCAPAPPADALAEPAPGAAATTGAIATEPESVPSAPPIAIPDAAEVVQPKAGVPPPTPKPAEPAAPPAPTSAVAPPPAPPAKKKEASTTRSPAASIAAVSAESSTPATAGGKAGTTRSGSGSRASAAGSQDTSNGVAKQTRVPPSVQAAVDAGKLKDLTVTKLRRMLSECGLKTSGRKSELIARLTSYVRK